MWWADGFFVIFMLVMQVARVVAVAAAPFWIVLTLLQGFLRFSDWLHSLIKAPGAKVPVGAFVVYGIGELGEFALKLMRAL